jgi:branched-chain amino acid transport system ATP-binding protein
MRDHSESPVNEREEPNGNRVAGKELLRARGVSAGYHGHPVVPDLNLHVQEGEIVALFGPNGAGKTTTVLTLAGDLVPLGGEIWFDGKKTRARLHRRVRRGLALVTEERSVFMQLSTIENLRVGRCEIDEALTLFPELRPLLKRRAGLLSGGEQQILTVARALARRPRLLLADELSLGLGPMIVTRLLTALREAADRLNVGVLLVEQHVQQALRVADRVYVMRNGQIVAHSTPDEIGADLETLYLAADLSQDES